MKLITKKFESKYKENILELFKKTYHSEMKLQFWDWRFENNPFGDPIIQLAFFENRLVANYLIHPINLQIDSVHIRALFSMTTMTDPDFSGQGIMTNLAREAYDEGEKKGYSLVYGFANKNSRHMFTKKLGFKELSTMYETRIDVTTELQLESNCECNEIQSFDESFSDFYETVNKEMHMLMIPRTSRYLNWRFKQKPDNEYYCYQISNNNNLLGYFVLKDYKGIKCHIIDFLIKDDMKCYNSMISKAMEFSRSRQVNDLSLWINKRLPLYQYVMDIGFKEYPQENYFVTKILSGDIGDKVIETYDNWYITMSDSDVY